MTGAIAIITALAKFEYYDERVMDALEAHAAAWPPGTLSANHVLGRQGQRRSHIRACEP